jgi:CRISPR-associated protein Csd2
MFDHDHSAARGKMNARKLIVFKHETALGNAPAHRLFDLIQISRVSGNAVPARSFADYDVKVREEDCPSGVAIQVKI